MSSIVEFNVLRSYSRYADVVGTRSEVSSKIWGRTYAQPGNDVRVGGVTSATGVLLITSRLDHDGVVQGSFPRGVQGAHVEDVNTLHLSEDFETLETGGLLEIGRDGTGGGTRSDKVVLSLDIYN
jgi:hypothetical protein